MIHDVLRTELVELAIRLAPDGIDLLVGGGYGLVLKAEHLLKTGTRTLRQFPVARSTEDIDLFLRADVIVSAERMERVRRALADRGYEPVPSAKYYQFAKPVTYNGRERAVKVDLLAAVPERAADRVRRDVRRIRPRGYSGLHAHTTPEAITIEERPLPLEIAAGGHAATVYVPHPFSYLLLKLFALRDQVGNGAKDFGRYHAFDLYAIVAMLTLDEWNECGQIRAQFGDAGPLVEGRAIAAELFASATARGALRLMEHARATGIEIPATDLDAFVVEIRELLGASAPAPS